MRQAVRDAFPAFTERFEGKTTFMYLDVLGLVTTGLGNLVDPIQLAAVLPWRTPSGYLATYEQIRVAWFAVKSKLEWRKMGGRCYEPLTDIRLDDEGIAQLVNGKLALLETQLRQRYPALDAWPADAQLGVLSMAWAMGASFKFPRFDAAVARLDFATAADECTIDVADNPGVRPRNVANKMLFEAAMRVILIDGDRDELHLETSTA